MTGETESKIRDFLVKNIWLERSILALAGVGVWFSLFLVFLVVPNEQVMGAVQRIFYFHVGSALSCYFQIAILFIGSVLYLNFRTLLWDQIAETGATLALVFCAIVLLSGMIWGDAAWGTWWRWEPRLVSSLVLFLILAAYSILRVVLKDDERVRSFAATVGVISAVNVPIVIYSIKILSPESQLHPEVVANQGLKDIRYITAFIFTNLSMISMGLLFFLHHVRLVIVEQEILELERRIN